MKVKNVIDPICQHETPQHRGQLAANLPPTMLRGANLALVDRRHAGRVPDAKANYDSRGHELDAREGGTHQEAPYHDEKRPKEQGSLPTEGLGSEGREDGSDDRAHVIQRCDGSDDERRRVVHRVEPVGRDHNTGHDALVITEQQEAGAAYRGDGSDQPGPPKRFDPVTREKCRHGRKHVYISLFIPDPSAAVPERYYSSRLRNVSIEISVQVRDDETRGLARRLVSESQT